MNPGSEPDRDDFGLPPVDIQIPDDARELDRDVQAYLRELRALRRRDRVSRLRGPLARDGMVLPLLAGCLILALVPQDCRCAPALEQLSDQAVQAHVTLYLVGTATIMPEVFQLATQAGQPAAQVAEDPSNVLGRTYGGSGMTAVLVGSDGTVPLVVHDVVQPANLKLAEAGLRQLGSATPAVR